MPYPPIVAYESAVARKFDGDVARRRKPAAAHRNLKPPRRWHAGSLDTRDAQRRLIAKPATRRQFSTFPLRIYFIRVSVLTTFGIALPSWSVPVMTSRMVFMSTQVDLDVT